MAKNSTLPVNPVVLGVVSGVLVALLALFGALVFYLLRSKSSTCKKIATDEEKQSVLIKHSGGPVALVSTKVVNELGPDRNSQSFHHHSPDHLDPLKTTKGVRSNYGGSNSSVRSAKSIKERRRISEAGSNNSLTLSIGSSASQTSQASSRKSRPSSVHSKEYRSLLSKSKPLTVEDLESIVNSSGQLSTEFMLLPNNNPECVDVRGYDKTKNRHPQLLPNNQTRIRLSGNKYRTEADGYINANHIRGFRKGATEFIAAQGPLPSTVEDFWWMIWQEKVSVVVMLTKLNERNKSMCEKYWPLNKATYGDIMVTLYSETRHSSYEVNEFLIAEIESANQRRVDQYCYFNWPDKDVPEDTSAIFAIMEDITRQRQSSCSPANPPPAPAPILVHCSAGIGRTGCYIALNSAIDQFEYDGKIDVLGTVAKIRLDRGSMVQNLEQYEFIHKSLLHYIKHKSTLPTPSNNSNKFFEEDENEH